MADLTAADFPSFFEELWRHPPFDWQVRLAAQVLGEGRFPDVIDLPTGSGKTSVIDVAVFALATRPGVFARRIAFVIDRRVVVDQTSDRADALATALSDPAGPVTRRVADSLNALSGMGRPLEVARLRGGIPLDSGWARWPDQPAVIVSTVDQVGSRLLFRGYGVSPNMWPVHAGLVGNDCLVLLDEVHLSTAFAETLTAVRSAARTVRRLPRRGQVVEMSATPAADASTRFRLTDTDLADRHSELATRVLAPKQARLEKIGKAKTPPEDAFGQSIATLIEQLPDQATTIGIIVNRVRTARQVATALLDANAKVHLITGRMRPADRADVTVRVQTAADPERAHEVAERDRTIVVATQTIEVGADLSFDAMITEIAPLDSLRQRFGRLDRRGSAARSGHPAQALIVAAASTLSETTDPIYGDSLHRTWDSLEKTFGANRFDVGPTSVDLAALPNGLHAPRGYAPILLDAHVDQFVQTSPAPWVTPAVELYLHGVPQPGEEQRQTDVSVVWRADVDLDDEERCAEALRIMRPRSDEAMPVPIHAARAWLRRADVEVPVGDVPIAATGDRRPRRTDDTRVIRWRGNDSIDVIAVADIAPGDTIVVHVSQGGITLDNWDPSSRDHVMDRAHEAAAAAGRPVLRLIPELAPSGASEPPTASASDVDEAGDLRSRVEVWIASLDNSAAALIPSPWKVVLYRPGGEDCLALIEARPTVRLDDLDGSDDSNSMTGTAVSLIDHLEGVGALAADFARRVGLSEALVADFDLAGRAHDLGKVDRRFQLMLHGDPIAYAMADEPVAKSRPGQAGRRRFGYPMGARHEFATLTMVEAEQQFISNANDPDLVRHLVVTHHGRGRPLPLVVVDPDPEKLDIDVFGHHFVATSEVPIGVSGPASAERFWRLIERYGTHGLAWLEAIFRLADHRRSQLESERQSGVEANDE